VDPARRGLLARLYGAALSGVEPEAAVRRALRRREIREALGGRRGVGVFAVGKAAAAMARGALRVLPGARALVILPRGHPAKGLSGAAVARAAHPEPDASSVRAARRALRFFAGFGAEDAIVCLVSGGASSLLTLPRPGVSLAEKRRRVRALVRSGASIAAVNRLRTSLSAVKGGGLAASTPARLVTLVLSDVPGDRARLVGSSPTIRARGRRGDVAPGSGAPRDLVRVVGSNRAGLSAAAREARRLGISARVARRRLAGEARTAGERLARRARALPPGTVWLEGGETVVALGSARERGGRCLELALAAACGLDGNPDVALLAAGSDGRDGSSSAAGAFGDGATVARARTRRLDPRRALATHATHALFARLGDLFVTGPTGTNVGDWVFLLRAP
jgi:hydroxypyruvate reductase